MYSLWIFCDGSSTPKTRIAIAQAADVLAAIPKIIEDHPGCERVEVHNGATRLFSVDCDGSVTTG